MTCSRGDISYSPLQILRSGLRYLVAICKDLGRPYDAYQQKLARLDRTPQAQSGRGALTRVGGDGEGRAGRSAGGALGRGQEDDQEGGRPKKGSPMHAPMARGESGSTPKRGTQSGIPVINTSLRARILTFRFCPRTNTQLENQTKRRTSQIRMLAIYSLECRRLSLCGVNRAKED